MGKKPKGAAVKAKNKKIDPSELPKDKPPPLAEEVSSDDDEPPGACGRPVVAPRDHVMRCVVCRTTHPYIPACRAIV